ncbi:hypothetical protein [Mucilaginibacter flavus]|uniref:hypothetical protein n=1 Tax=Mucilaginibacter flavus TaxID=931504 RepID=UPI0025B51D11|nr:hypothetical protein [Mucilaginibacter flavus]MDN3581201.1 hypothetical protein [Mucilaginibacter flavus]
MKNEYKLLISGFVAITLCDAIGSIASRQFVFNYAILAFISFTIYAVFGFLGTRSKNLKTGIFIAACVGFFDSTIGWGISTILHANTGNVQVHLTPVIWLTGMAFTTITAALSGLIGGVFTKIIKGRS